MNQLTNLVSTFIILNWTYFLIIDSLVEYACDHFTIPNNDTMLKDLEALIRLKDGPFSRVYIKNKEDLKDQISKSFLNDPKLYKFIMYKMAEDDNYYSQLEERFQSLFNDGFNKMFLNQLSTDPKTLASFTVLSIKRIRQIRRDRNYDYI